MSPRDAGTSGIEALKRGINLVAYHFPPSTAVGGMRAEGLARHWAAQGIPVRVYTASSPSASVPFNVVHVPDPLKPGTRAPGRLSTGEFDPPGLGSRGSVLRRSVGRLAKRTVLVPDEACLWARKVERIIKNGPDARGVLVTSAYPVSAHMVGLGLNDADLVWVADFRDLWTQNPYYHLGAARKAVDRRLEASVLKHAAAVTTTTMASAELLSQRYPSATVMPIYNGFEPIAWPEGSLSANARRRIVYAGSLYGGLRSPELLFCALSQLPENVRHRLDVVFCGTPEPSFDHDVQQWGLGDCVSHVGLLSREQATALMRSADVLLTISWDDSGERRVLPGKVFEYLSTERPILAVGASADSELGRFLSRTDAGTVATDLASVLTCLNAIADTGFPAGQAGIRCNVEHFTQKVMAERFLDLIRGIRT